MQTSQNMYHINQIKMALKFKFSFPVYQKFVLRKDEIDIFKNMIFQNKKTFLLILHLCPS